MVKIKFNDGEEIEEAAAMNFGYNLGKYGDMSVVLVGADETTMISVHTGVRSAWRVPGPQAVATAIDISSMAKKAA